MIKEVKMPSAGQTTDEVVIYHWLVAKGDKVQRGDILLEAETDKATLPIESFAKGIILDLLVKEGDTVNAGSVLALIGDESDLASYTSSTTNQPAGVANDIDDFVPIIKDLPNASRPKTAADNQVSQRPVEVRAMPNAKRMAAEQGIDLVKVKPSSGGLIKRSDVKAYHDAKNADLSARDSVNAEQRADEVEYQVLPLSGMRRKIGSSMLKSVQTIPAFQLSIQIDMTGANKLKDGILAKFNMKISYNDIFAKAIAVTAKEFSLLNARYEGDEIRVYRHCNIGLAVGLEQGLVVPVIKNVDTMEFIQIAVAAKAAVDKAHSGSLVPSDMGSGSTTISNLGMHGIEHFTAIINPPECSIFALGNITSRPIWQEGTWKSAPMMEVTASYDHRVIDGSYGARILKSIKGLLENPALMPC